MITTAAPMFASAERAAVVEALAILLLAALEADDREAGDVRSSISVVMTPEIRTTAEELAR